MLLIKSIYILAVCIFCGNMFWGANTKLKSDRTGDKQLMKRALSRIFRSDIFLTVPSLSIIALLNFTVNSNYFIFSIEVKWLVLLLLVHSLAIFLIVIHPLRMAMYKMLKTSNNYDVNMYRAFSKTWFVWGTIELAPLIAILVISTTKLC